MLVYMNNSFVNRWNIENVFTGRMKLVAIVVGYLAALSVSSLTEILE